ncbi:hypothetical protein NQ314_020415 [Rhamnusium bicolor]|uniref:Uncharacterized protein n=1 Tax=Rhamnusium bicolor TaxID=1586634 RepID=A0AAV8WLH7_9CUCU|nr:hypothetical protein NQ314_020415 [Rhamnusium bicolor]
MNNLMTSEGRVDVLDSIYDADQSAPLRTRKTAVWGEEAPKSTKGKSGSNIIELIDPTTTRPSSTEKDGKRERIAARCESESCENHEMEQRFTMVLDHLLYQCKKENFPLERALRSQLPQHQDFLIMFALSDYLQRILKIFRERFQSEKPEESKDDIPVIPDLDDLQDDPLNLPDVKPIEQGNFGDLGDTDLSFLTSKLYPERDVQTCAEVWTMETLINDLLRSTT